MNVKLILSIVLPLATILLSGCSTPTKPRPDPISQLQQNQAREINQNLPVTVDGVSLVHARAEGHTLSLILYQSTPDRDTDTFMMEYAHQLCLQPEIVKNMNSGGVYRMEWSGGTENVAPAEFVRC